jgi:predicted dehydrogenase
MPTPTPVRWGILGTANIARAQFLPGLHEAGGGTAALVASRDADRARAYAAAHGVERGVAGYAAVTDAPDIDAVYVALPNSEHAEWAIRALRAGKAVLCEKPLCTGSAQAQAVLDVAATAPRPLWEAFVFPFQAQHRRLTGLLGDGAIGEPAELVSAFHFRLTNRANIRLSATLGGGALADVGCYPVRLAYELFGAGLRRAGASATVVAAAGDFDGEVEADTSGLVRFGPRRLLLTCGFRRPSDTFTRVLGDAGAVHMTNPFHPSPADTLTIRRPGADPVTERPTTDQRSFTAAIRHVHAVLRDEAAPEHTAAQWSLPAARTLEDLQAAAAAGRAGDSTG